MQDGFVVIPDDPTAPTAVFQELADATDWALAKYGSNAFRICYHRGNASPQVAPPGRVMS
jgi:hypothetical protein